MKISYKLLNNVIGWAVFIIASVVYLITMEPTVSWWDCGEFISAANKLEVGHPPGAPFFMLIGRLFAMFAPNQESVAMMVNASSAICSSFTILFLFWTITYFAKKMMKLEETDDSSKLILVLGSGVVGALAFTFSDSFWFSAAEGEVYAMSSFFTAIVFWFITKWERVSEEPGANKWIVLIAFTMGLSIGVHLLNLLTIPAIAYVVYFKKKKEINFKGIFLTAIVSLLILGAVQVGVISWLIGFASKFELFFVNGLGMGYGSGIIVYAVLFIALITFLIYWTVKTKKVLLNTILLSFLFIVLGFSTYAIIPIRSKADTPINMNKPDNIFSLISFLNREQYGDFPVFYGQYYNAPVVEQTPKYTHVKKTKIENGKEVKYYEKQLSGYNIKYDPDFCTILPRMYSSEERHVKKYKEWGQVKGVKKRVKDPQTNEMKVVAKPTFGENMRYFFSYQIGHMYLRYFAWNFIGRQNDAQGFGDITKGNWISGIPAIDNRLGDQDKLYPPFDNKKTRNTYFFLPFLLGLLGLGYQFYKDSKNSFIVLVLFILTGIAIIVYLNQKPNEPRERDYAYVGSFYAFAIWIGLGVIGLWNILKQLKLNSKIAAMLSVLLAFTAVPMLMASQNWDDHDRSGRTAAGDIAYNYLVACDQDGILVTNADNDTYPLWFKQEVEEYKTDVRVMCTALLRGSSYLNQMRRSYYDAPSVPHTLPDEIMMSSDYYPVFIDTETPKSKKARKALGIGEWMDIDMAMEFLKSDNPITKHKSRDGSGRDLLYLPVRKFRVPVDSATVVENGIVAPEDAYKIEPYIEFSVSGNMVSKDVVLILDILATNNWKQPLYFVNLLQQPYKSLRDYLQLDGLVYKLVPFKNTNNTLGLGSINSSRQYDLLVNKFKWGNLADPDVFVCEHNRRMIYIINPRNLYSQLAVVLFQEGKKDKAKEVMDVCEKNFPMDKFPVDYYSLTTIKAYGMMADKENLQRYVRSFVKNLRSEMSFYISLPDDEQRKSSSQIGQSRQLVAYAYKFALLYGQDEAFTEEIKNIALMYYDEDELNRIIKQINY